VTREAVIVSLAHTPIGRADKGAFNNTQAQALGGHAIANENHHDDCPTDCAPAIERTITLGQDEGARAGNHV